jgi:hypothetical protein
LNVPVNRPDKHTVKLDLWRNFNIQLLSFELLRQQERKLLFCPENLVEAEPSHPAVKIVEASQTFSHLYWPDSCDRNLSEPSETLQELFQALSALG